MSRVAQFPSDIKGCMKDCILSLLWRRQDILNFFADHSCTQIDLKAIAGFKEREMSRSTMVDTMFGQLTSRADEGLGPFRSMLQALITWSHFDSYWFDKKKKLDRARADNNIAHLRQLQEIRDAKIKEQRQKRERAQEARQNPNSTLAQLKAKFLDLHSGKSKPQRRGYELQDILLELGRLARLEVTEPFTVKGEQIDGTIKYDGEHYLVEAKWQDKAASNEPVYQLAAKVEGKLYGRGFFISVNGFSENVVVTLVKGKALKTILVDGEDIVLVLEGHLGFDEMIDRKVKAAQTKGLIYIHPITGAAKATS